ncbi:palmitoyltransferase, putative [Plasmodium gallinaceum]|uniref:Palmitoyltransferase n=1 Tax=Plasmodium gallinaceum TaxID=5849 RepID=A0A1J1GL56_PLAGA|nr:palmitoyltransferase, putative [Plasmodium gallinaceum]CRG93051.1 palmitoyltransferase, putative [Plasmodium gallinaceum]
MSNVNEEGSKNNNLVDNSKIIIVPNQKESSDNKTKKKKKNKNKKSGNDENRKYSTDKSIINITKNIKDEIKDNLVLDTINNIKNEETNKDQIETSQIVQSNKSKLVRLLPVIFIFILLLGIYLIYIMYHCLPLIYKDYKKVYINYDFKRGLIEIIIFHFFLIMYLINYILSIIIPPGSIPNTEEWAFNDYQENYTDEIEYYLLEKKKSGERRYCKWCCKFKPDRTHHCRVCKTCILKMDHHCPWIYNCVGWNNHKYFMLSLIYCCITSIFVSITMFNSVKDAIKNVKTPFSEMFLLLFGETLNSFLALIITCFLFFHIWLMINAMTTIEFCEKQTNYQNQSYSKYYNKGLWGNFKDVFGDSPFLWFLPIDNRKGDGINFVKGYNRGHSEETTDETLPIKGKC